MVWSARPFPIQDPGDDGQGDMGEVYSSALEPYRHNKGGEVHRVDKRQLTSSIRKVPLSFSGNSVRNVLTGTVREVTHTKGRILIPPTHDVIRIVGSLSLATAQLVEARSPVRRSDWPATRGTARRHGLRGLDQLERDLDLGHPSSLCCSRC